jgi:hypothetical protein
MNNFFPHGRILTEEQVATILDSPLVQTDPTGQKFIDITPITIVGSEPAIVSEPTTLLPLGGSLGMLLIAAAVNRTQKSTSGAARCSRRGEFSGRDYRVGSG